MSSLRELLAGLPPKPCFADYYQIVPLQLEKTLLRSPGRTLALKGRTNQRLLIALAQRLNGERPLIEVAEELVRQDFAAFLVANLLQTLHRQGVLLDELPPRPTAQAGEAPDSRYHPQLLYFQQISSRSPQLEQQLLAQAQVIIFGLGSIGSHLLVSLARSGVGHLVGVDNGSIRETEWQGTAYPYRAINQSRVEAARQLVEFTNPAVRFSGLELEPTPENLPQATAAFGPERASGDSAGYGRADRLIVAAFDQPRPAFYEAINEYCLDYELNWTMGQLDGFTGLIGPSFIPFYGPCYHCYRSRVHSNILHYEAHLAYEASLEQPPISNFQPGQLAPFTPLLAHSLSLEVLKLLGNYAYAEAVDRLISFDFLNLKLESHPVLKLPNCPACGRLSSRHSPVAHYEVASHA